MAERTKTKAEQFWEDIKKSLRKSTAGKPEDDDEPADEPADDSTDDDDDEDEYEDATATVKALTEKIVGLEESIEVMAKAQTAMLEKMKESEILQKSIGQGILAVMDRTEEVLASPSPRKGATTALEVAALKKSLAGGGAEGGDGAGKRLKPFTKQTFDLAKDILLKAVSDGEISTEICAGYETQINKSIGKAAFPFTDDFVAFMTKHSG
ncbi:MAG: hypothetical protein LBQ89_08185 [Treponema sp.]|jgi:hypothetical protein|nr:hypothetical protein [Treponema sp.]